MLIAGETIELNLGYFLGISTLACAALGNLVSDVFGLGANSFIEATARKLGLKDPKLTVYQLGTRRVKVVQLVAASVGVTIGKMFPSVTQPVQTAYYGYFQDVYSECSLCYLWTPRVTEKNLPPRRTMKSSRVRSLLSGSVL